MDLAEKPTLLRILKFILDISELRKKVICTGIVKLYEYFIPYCLPVDFEKKKKKKKKKNDLLYIRGSKSARQEKNPQQITRGPSCC